MSILRITAFAMTATWLWTVPGTALGQAWVPIKNSLSTSLDYTFGPSDRIVESEDFPDIDAPGLANHTAALSAEYTPPVENLAISVTVPIVTTRYAPDVDNPLLPPHGSNDDGKFHPAFQDARAILRYQVLPNHIMAVAPHIGVSVPMSNYETQGFAGHGRGLKQLHVGLGVGHFVTDGPMRNVYLHTLFEYSKVERFVTAFPETAEYNQDRIDLKGIIGYFISDKLEINLGFDWRRAMGGLHFKDITLGTVPPWVVQNHDALLAESFLLLGGGVTYELKEGVRFNAVFRYWTTGENTRDTHIIGGGLAWDVM